MDAATRAQITRGERLIEILKQDQYLPMPVTMQVLSIYAVNLGVCDDMPVESVRPFEAALHSHFTSAHAELVASIRDNGEMKKDIEPKVNEVIRAFAKDFKAGLAGSSRSSGANGSLGQSDGAAA